jgi:7,8-dihydropterin-6-yl-methyl-4-(beta-D-ribofuranosyl)aminobenzene 5'-phosphate synthase
VDGSIAPDVVPDDQALAINVKGLGLVVLTGCSHAGVINTVEAARETTGISTVHAVMGGFHLGFPGVPEEKTEKTIAVMQAFEPKIVAPMHCTGFRATMRFAAEMPGAFLLNVAGTTVSFQA